ncbi:MAG: energy transducer TonB [Nitrospiria bacterium]
MSLKESESQTNAAPSVVNEGVPPSIPNEIEGNSASLHKPGSVQTSMIKHSAVIGSETGTPGKSVFNFPSYFQKMENKISGEWAPPSISFQGESIGVVIRFNIRNNGRLERESIEVEKSSGNPFFDQAAMRAVFGADPFPPLPDALSSEDRLRIHFSFTVLEDS